MESYNTSSHVPVRCTLPIQVFGEVGTNKLLERPYAESSSSRNENTLAFLGYDVTGVFGGK